MMETLEDVEMVSRNGWMVSVLSRSFQIDTRSNQRSSIKMFKVGDVVKYKLGTNQYSIIEEASHVLAKEQFIKLNNHFDGWCLASDFEIVPLKVGDKVKIKGYVEPGIIRYINKSDLEKSTAATFFDLAIR
jgi:hypothetical protein